SLSSSRRAGCGICHGGPPRSTNKVLLREALILYRKALYAALKRRSSTVFQGFVRAPCEIKIKSSGQECPLHTRGA
ncbi:MAG: hypothetical protein WBW31_16015, partial [Candidatus Sulfotelmatobacter sp.]